MKQKHDRELHASIQVKSMSISQVSEMQTEEFSPL